MGHIFVISAPSGAGKTTLCLALRQRCPHLAYSVSYTTRAPRTGEQNGKDYFFISEKEFEQGIAQKRWAEWARVYGNYYGTSATWISETIAAGVKILMDIDIQGAKQIVARFPQAVTIFILPPSLEVLAERLIQRKSDTPEAVAARLANARQEMAQKKFYLHHVVNDDLENAVDQLVGIIKCHEPKGSETLQPSS